MFGNVGCQQGDNAVRSNAEAMECVRRLMQLDRELPVVRRAGSACMSGKNVNAIRRDFARSASQQIIGARRQVRRNLRVRLAGAGFGMIASSHFAFLCKCIRH